ncbi:MAG: hypothetical protein A2Y76_03750 [Planctomycetes bacterium RBG_13_60_9]|nr:MAG: hypothetical protein A2Y76_03750 [Planctomycetes bacterium RBG_13_60_9]
MMSPRTKWQIDVPSEFFDACADSPDSGEALTETCGEYISIGSYDFLVAQARYFAWPHLTAEMLIAACVHEDAHNNLTMATALGHLELHIKTLLELAPKIPPADQLAQALRRYLEIVASSSTCAQETAATMSAYTALWQAYGSRVAEHYLETHRPEKPSGPSPYTTFVDRAIALFRKHRVRRQHWRGYMEFLASLAMNTDIDAIAAALPSLARFEELCVRSPIAADLRFIRVFREFEQSMREGGLPAEKKRDLERTYNHISKVGSGDLPRLLAEALQTQAAEFGLNKLDKAILEYVRRNPFGYPGKSTVQTIFYAAQPRRKAGVETCLFSMDSDACTQCDLVELGLASYYENVTYGGVSLNFYATHPPPIKVGFWMVHPCCAAQCSEFLHNKTLVVYFTRAFLLGGKGAELIRSLVAGRRAIYVFFGNHDKFLEWVERNGRHLVYTLAETQRPPVRFVLFGDERDALSRYVLPVAPIRCDHLDSLLSKIKRVTMSKFVEADFRADFDRFFPWYIFAPVTCQSDTRLQWTRFGHRAVCGA